MVKKEQKPQPSSGSSWWVVLIYIILILGILAGIAYGLYRLYQHLKRKGTCGFKKFSPDSSLSLRASAGDSDMVQVGYITCSGGGPLWKSDEIRIINNGPGTFYIGPVPDSDDPQELDSGDTMTLKMSNQAPNVYYKDGAKHTTPYLTVVPI